VLLRVRDTGGVVMVTFVPWFLSERWRSWGAAVIAEEARLADLYPVDGPEFARARDAWVREHPAPPCGLGDVADHLEHVREVAGVDCVGLGGDFDGTPVTPTGLSDVAGYPALLAELAGRGWSDADLAKVTWHNGLRVLRQTEAAARAARRERGPSLATFAQLDGAPPLDGS
jgi:membrane dipeptidase